MWGLMVEVWGGGQGSVSLSNKASLSLAVRGHLGVLPVAYWVKHRGEGDRAGSCTIGNRVQDPG